MGGEGRANGRRVELMEREKWGETGGDGRRWYSVLHYACFNFLQTLLATCVPFGACGTTKLGLVLDWPLAGPQQRASTSVQPHLASADHCSLQWRCESEGIIR